MQEERIEAGQRSEEEFHNKVCVVSFLFSLLVVMIHSFNADMFLAVPARSGAEGAVWQLQHMMADVIGPVAVPGFFMLSSYQFFRNCTAAKVPEKMKRRIRTVLLPYILWNFLYYMGYALAGRLPFLAWLSDKTQIELSIPAAAEAVLHFTCNPVFWYMYQLIFLIALSPVLYFILKGRVTGLLLIAAELFCVRGQIRLFVINMDALFYYSAAGYAAFHASRLIEGEWEKKGGGKAALIRLLTGAAGLCLAVYFYQGITMRHSVLETVLYRFTVPAVFWICLPKAGLFQAPAFMKYGFFLYSIHFILARGLNKTGEVLLPHTAPVCLALYLLIPAVCVLVSWKGGELLKRYAAPLWSLLTGGR